MRGRLLLASPRPPRADGRGDQRRAREILDALSGEWEVDVVSWLPDPDDRRSPWSLLPRLAAGAPLALVRPLHVAYVQALAGRRLRRRLRGDGYDRVVYVTDRAVPLRFAGPRAVVDFVDDIGGSVTRRAQSQGGPAAALWRWEAWRTRRLDRRLARSAAVAVAHSPADAARIDPRVVSIPLPAATRWHPGAGERVVFVGNLFYGPNHEAGLWICSQLAPCLAARGIEPSQMLLAGRRPRADLVAAAAAAGVELRADVPSLTEVIHEAVVVVAPMAMGVGALYKVVDAVAAHRPCVLTPLANEGLGLVDGESALVRDRDPDAFAAAVADLVADPALRRRLASRAAARLASHSPEAVAAAWRAAVAGAECGAGAARTERAAVAMAGPDGDSTDGVGESEPGESEPGLSGRWWGAASP